jgi:20S proteasome alpha/beta subunit
MTTVVAIQGDGFAVMGTDSRLSTVDTNGYVTRIHTMSSNVSKIAQINGCSLVSGPPSISLIAWKKT